MLFNKSLSSILLVQPNFADQMAFVAALETIEDGFLFGVSSNREEAADLLQRSMILPDLIFIDLDLTNGVHFLKEIQSDPLTNEIIVIAFANSPEEKQIALQYGIRDVIFKSAQHNELSSQIEKLLRTWSKKSIQPSRRINPE